MNTFISLLAQYSSTYQYGPTATDAAVAASVLATLMLVTLIFSIGAYVIMALGLMRIFKKAGVEGWIAWVPFYNNWKLLEIGGQQGFWAVLAIIPFVNIVSAIFIIIAMYHVGLKLGKSGVFVLLAIFLPLIWVLILGFDSSKWQDKEAEQPAQPAVAA